MGTAKVSSPAKTKTRRGTESSLVLVSRDSLIFEDSSTGIFKNEVRLNMNIFIFGSCPSERAQVLLVALYSRITPAGRAICGTRICGVL